MIDKNLLCGLVCPQSQGALELAQPQLVEAVNGVILDQAESGNHSRRVEALQMGLFCRKSSLLYPLRNDIPILLLEEAIRVPDSIIQSLDLR